MTRNFADMGEMAALSIAKVDVTPTPIELLPMSLFDLMEYLPMGSDLRDPSEPNPFSVQVSI